jgi:osmotically-inducible protein OsmY
MRTPISFALGLATGAAAAHFLDPEGGRRRRNRMRDQAHAKASQAASAVQSQATHAAHHAKGAAHAVTPSPVGRDHPADAPKGRVSVDVQAGVAYLRGEVPTRTWIAKLGDDAGHVDGIKGVQNLLHTPGTPTPAAEPRGVAAEQLRP